MPVKFGQCKGLGRVGRLQQIGVKEGRGGGLVGGPASGGVED